MDFFEFIHVAHSAIMTNKARSLLTMLGIIIGVSSVILLVSIGSGLQSFVTQQFASLGSNSIYVFPGSVDLKSGSAPMSPITKFEISDVADIKRAGDVIEDVSPVTMVLGTLAYRGEYRRLEIVGIWENYLTMQNFTAEYGRMITQNDVERSRKVVVLGNKPYEDLFEEGDDPLGNTITINDVQYEVVGVLDKKGSGGAFGGEIDNHAFIPLTTAFRQFDQTKPYAIIVKASSQESVPEASAVVKQTLLKRLKKDDFTVLEQTELLNTIQQFLAVITTALGGIAAISLLVGGIGIMNIMLVSVTERTREIGLRKAVGATPKDILVQFLIESVFLSLVGGSIGIALGAVGSFALSRFIQTFVTGWSILIAFSFSAFVGIVFGVAPAIRAARLDPIESLRYE